MRLLRRFIVVSIPFALFACAPSGGGSSGGKTPDTNVDVSTAKIDSVSPANDAVGVSKKTVVIAQFSQAIDPQSITPATFTLFHGGNQIAGSVSSDGISATFTPTDPLSSVTHYKATLASGSKGVKDASGLPLAAEFSWTFTTQDGIPPTVESTTPVNGEIGFLVTAPIKATFSEEMNASTINANTFKVQGPLGPVTGAVSYSAKVATFQPSAPLQPLGPAVFTASIAGTVTDITGNPMGSTYFWSFTTQDQTPPQVVSVSPVNGSAGVIFTENPSVTFNEPMDPASLTTATFQLLESGTTPVPGLVNYISATNTAVFDPTGSLKANTSYTFFVTGGSSGVKDASGNPLASNCSLCSATFSTISGWAPPQNIESLDFDAINPQMLAAPLSAPYPAGSLFAVWQQRSSTTNPIVYDIHAAMFDALLNTWTTPVVIDKESGDGVNPQMAMGPDGALMVVYQQKIGSETQYSILAVKYNPALGWPAGWGTPVAIESETATTTAAINPQVAAGADGSFMAAFQQKITGQTGVNSILANRFDPATGTWASSATLLEDSTFESSLPQVASFGTGEYVVVFQQRTGTAATLPNNILAARYTAGSGWPAALPFAELLETGDFDAQNPRLAVIPQGAPSAGLVYAVWQQKLTVDPSFSIVSAVYNPEIPPSWSSAAPIESAAGDSTLPFPASGPGGEVYVVWQKKLGTDITPSAVVNRFTLGGGWGTDGAVIENLSSNLISDARIVVSPNGRVMAVWAQSDWILPPYSIVANEMQAGGIWEPTAVVSVESTTDNAAKPQVVATPSNNFFTIFQQLKAPLTVNNIYVGQAP